MDWARELRGVFSGTIYQRQVLEIRVTLSGPESTPHRTLWFLGQFRLEDGKTVVGVPVSGKNCHVLYVLERDRGRRVRSSLPLFPMLNFGRA